MLELKLFILLITANGAPIIARYLFGNLYSCPLDGGWLFPDKKALFGESKTIRGIISAITITILVGLLIGIPVNISLIIALFAMLGDLFSSFIKRRLDKPAGSMFIGLDQIPESLLPLLSVRSLLDLEISSIVIIVVAFFIAELLLSRILYILHIRKHPY